MSSATVDHCHTGWMPVTGTAQTRTTLQPLTLVAPRTHLVQDTLD